MTDTLYSKMVINLRADGKVAVEGKFRGVKGEYIGVQAGRSRFMFLSNRMISTSETRSPRFSLISVELT